MKHFLRYAYFLIFIAGIPTIISCSGEDPPEKEIIRPVKVIKIPPLQTYRYRELPGTIKSSQEALLSFNVSGKLKSIVVVPGQTVRRSQKLAALDDRDYINNRNQARAELNRSRAHYERIQQAVKAGAVAQQDLTNALASYKASQAQFDIVKKALQDTVLTAPFAGKISSQFFDNFENIQAKEPIFKILNPKMFEVTINVPEKLFQYHEKAKNPWVSIEQYQHVQIPAKQTESSYELDSNTGTYTVTFEFSPPEDLNIISGMSANVWLSLPHEAIENYSNIPPSSMAIDPATNHPYVYILENERVTKRNVTILHHTPLSEQGVNVTGLKTGDIVIIAGIANLHEGQKVKAIEQQ